METLTDHYVVYHSVEKMGISCEELVEGPFEIVTSKSVANLLNQVIWVISGQGTPRQYSLCSVFIVDEIGRLQDGDFTNYARGSTGFSFRPVFVLNEYDWFRLFLRSQSRFTFGLQKIDQQYVQELEQIADQFINENPDSTLVLEIFEELTVEDYIGALATLHNQMSEIDLLMLRVNYESLNHTTSATQLANRVGFRGFEAANLRYGSLAAKFCDYFQLHPRIKLSALVEFERPSQEWLWIMRPQLVEAIHELGWFEQAKVPDAIEDLEQHRESYQELDETIRTAVIRSRIGQGRFRADLINYWGSCAVTGCQVTDLLRASHIKPWRDSNNNERLDPFNGFLLIPNLDAAFDRGLISFANDGIILISNDLDEEALLQLGINHSMNLRQVEESHFQYLQFHREKFGFEKE